MTYQETEKFISQELSAYVEQGESYAIAQRILEFITGIDRNQKHKTEKIIIDQAKLSQLKNILERVKNEEPIQYILQEEWFCGFKFFVNKHVLIPRPETEELVEWVISTCKFPIDSLSILDIGTGSGCIPISLKRRLRKAQVSAVDVSKDALEVANRNATNLGADVNFIEADILNSTCWSTLPKVDIITSNPPYVTESEKGQMKNNVLNYEPALALFVPDTDPLIFYKAISALGKIILNKNGTIFLEINEAYGNETANVFIEAGYKTEIKKDMQGKERMIKAMLN